MTAFSPYGAHFAPASVNTIPALIQSIGKELGCENETHLHVLTKALEVIKASKGGQSQGNQKQAPEPMSSSSQQVAPNMSGYPSSNSPSSVFHQHQFSPMSNGFLPQMLPQFPRQAVRAPSPVMNGYTQRMPPYPFPSAHQPSYQEWQAMQSFRQQQQAQVPAAHKAQSPVPRPVYRPHPYAFQQPTRTVPQMRPVFSPEHFRQPIISIPEPNIITDAQLAELDAFLSKDIATKSDHQSPTVSVSQSRPVPAYDFAQDSQVHSPVSQAFLEGPKDGFSDEDLTELDDFCTNLKKKNERPSAAIKRRSEGEEKQADFDNGIDRDILNEFLSFA